MRICFLAGASSIHTIRWVNAVVKRGHKVDLITMHPLKPNTIDPRVRVHQLKIRAPLGYYLNLLEAKRLIYKLQPDLLNVHYASGYGTLSRLINFKPTLLSVWGSDVYLFPYKSRRNEKIIRKNLEAADQIASTSEAMKQQTKSFINTPVPIIVTPFGIDLNFFKPVKEKLNDNIIIGTVKRLENIYGIDILLRAIAGVVERLHTDGEFDLFRRIRLQIVGSGSELPRLRQLAKELNINDIVEFSGMVPHSEVPAYLNQFDIYCALSRSESFGVAVIEASSCEVPVIVSKVGGLPEVVRDGETGYIVDHHDIDEIVEKIYKLINDSEKRGEMGKRGRAFVSKYYDWEQNVNYMIDEYDKLIKRFKK